MNIRLANNNDYKKISELADKNDLLIDGLSTESYCKTLAWLYSDLNERPKIQIVYEEDGNLIGHCGVAGFELILNGKYSIGGLVGNLVIDNQAKKSGIFFKIQDQLLIKSSIDFIFLFAPIVRREILQIQLRMGWKKVAEIFVFARPINLIGIFKRNFKSKFCYFFLKYPLLIAQYLFDIVATKKNSKVEIREISSFDNSHANFLSQWTGSQSMTSVRSVEILNWRFVASNRGYEIFGAYIQEVFKGYVVLRRMSLKKYSAIAIVDIIAMNEDSDIINSLISKSIKVAKSYEVDLMATSLPNHHPLDKFFFRQGFIKTAENFTVVVKYSKDKEEILAPLFKKWFINWFDHDFV